MFQKEQISNLLIVWLLQLQRNLTVISPQGLTFRIRNFTVSLIENTVEYYYIHNLEIPDILGLLLL